MSLHNRNLGETGEELAAKHLRREKYKILGRNVRTTCEMDIVCEKEGVVVFVEVKTRTGEKFGLPREAVDAKRQARYRTGAAAYLKKYNLSGFRVRFDVIEVTEEKITHIKDSF